MIERAYRWLFEAPSGKREWQFALACGALLVVYIVLMWFAA